MERIVIDGQRFVLKHLDLSSDWVMRATGDFACRPIVMWRSGLLDGVPSSIDHTVVDAAWDGRRGAVLMRDVGEHFLAEGDAEIPLEQHLRFLDHMAELQAAFWDFRDDVGLLPLGNRYLAFHHPLLAQVESKMDQQAAVPTIYVPRGWSQFSQSAGQSRDLVFSLHREPTPLLRALADTPQTLIHGDWKAGNLGSHPDGRTILVDWAMPGEAPACAEIAWYICLNRARLPHAKEDALVAYREALERHGIDTEPWWHRQLSLCLLGAVVQFGWEKALDTTEAGRDELAWWESRALEGARCLS